MKVDLYEYHKRLKKHISQESELELDLRNLVIDKSYSLDDRWEIFIKARFGENSIEQDFPYITNIGKI